MIDTKLFTASFDGTLRVWDASNLFSEHANQNKNDEKLANESKLPEKFAIENEKCYNLRINSSIDKNAHSKNGMDEFNRTNSTKLTI